MELASVLIAAASALVALVAIGVALRANKIAQDGNEIAQGANGAAVEANGLATKANEIGQQANLIAHRALSVASDQTQYHWRLIPDVVSGSIAIINDCGSDAFDVRATVRRDDGALVELRQDVVAGFGEILFRLELFYEDAVDEESLGWIYLLGEVWVGDVSWRGVGGAIRSARVEYHPRDRKRGAGKIW
ncbi:hypothetical protein [Trueperella pyogenes]|uniref:hypothetical protein n=1 Tax=Trueperella pyogenes TaxID=1661 RepID=UPI0032495D75